MKTIIDSREECPVCFKPWDECQCVSWETLDEWLDDLKFGIEDFWED